MIYLDHNATTPLDPEVLDAMLPYLQTLYGNPSSLYRLGRISRSAIDTAREQIANLVDARADQIIFTSGGTEANALAMNSFADLPLYISAIEHPSIFENTETRQGPTTVLTVTPQGMLDIDSPHWQNLQPQSALSIMMANNETGVIQDMAAISDYCHTKGIWIHSDAVQALGKLPFSFRQLDLDMLSISSHKIYGPKGCGALIIKNSTALKPLQRGGNQEYSLRAGTENVAAIVGFGKAAELAQKRMIERHNHLLELREHLEQQLQALPGVQIFSHQATRLINTVQFALDDQHGEMLLMQLDKLGFAVSSGSACKAGSGTTSPVLAAMGIPVHLAQSAIRISLGKDNTLEQIDQFITNLQSLAAHTI